MGALRTFAVGCMTLLASAALAEPREAAEPAVLRCPRGSTLATGEPDPTLFARAASPGVRAYWCERYDDLGRATRVGAYREVYPGGAVHASGRYVDSRLAGPIEIDQPDGTPFLRGFLAHGQWHGALSIFHENGRVWLEGSFQAGRLHGALRTHHLDGGLASETRFQNGREDGLARSFYSKAAGGGLKSEARVEADMLIGRHRLLDPSGKLRRTIDWDRAPIGWRAPSVTPPAAKRGRRDASASGRRRTRSTRRD